MYVQNASTSPVITQLLQPANLDPNQFDPLLASILQAGADYGDFFFESVASEYWMLEDGIVKEGFYSVERGVGVRVISGEKTGFAYADAINYPALTEALQAAKGIVRHGHGQHRFQVVTRDPYESLYDGVNPLHSLEDDQKISLLREIDAYARSLDSRVKQVMSTLAGSFQTVYIATTTQEHAQDLRPMVRLSVSVVVEANGQRETASAGGGGRHSYQEFLRNGYYRTFVQEAVRQALLLLDAQPAPAGLMPVVLGCGWPGILLHEAVGHGLEADFNRKKTSVFSGRLGEQVAAPGVTVVDNGTLANKRGSLHVDDEGVTTQCTTLIENGILQGYLHDRLNAHLMGMMPTGNGRRQSYAHLPMPRMTNTYMLGGSHSVEEMIASVAKGIYAVNFGGGQVDITSGNFVFSASEAYLIENGKITAPIKGATLTGHGPQVLTKVTMVGNDQTLDPGMGTCGKEGQSVPVGVGQPSLKISEMTVGGTQKSGEMA